MPGATTQDAAAAAADRPGRRWTDGWDVLTALGGRPVRAASHTARRLLAFALIVLATTVTKFGRASDVVHPMIWGQVRRAGIGLLPFVGLLSLVVGVGFVGQAVVLLRQVGAEDMLGTVLVVTLIRELGPLATAFLLLLRVGTATVVELATLRATGEVEALEALSIDPVHFLVMPRVLGLVVSMFCLTVYFIVGGLAAGYAFCFLREIPLAPWEFLNRVVRALSALDFVLLLVKTVGFGSAVAVITCYQGLARPLRLEQVPEAATRAVTHAVVACLVLDLVLLAVYLLD